MPPFTRALELGARPRVRARVHAFVPARLFSPSLAHSLLLLFCPPQLVSQTAHAPASLIVPAPAIGDKQRIRVTRHLNIEALGADGRILEASTVDETLDLQQVVLATEGLLVRAASVTALLERRVTPQQRKARTYEILTEIRHDRGKIAFKPEPKGPLLSALRKQYRAFGLPYGQLGPFRVLAALQGQPLTVGRKYQIDAALLRSQIGELSRPAAAGLDQRPITVELQGIETVAGRRCHSFTLRVALKGADRKQRVTGVIESQYLWDAVRTRPCEARAVIKLELQVARGQVKRVRISGRRTMKYRW